MEAYNQVYNLSNFIKILKLLLKKVLVELLSGMLYQTFSSKNMILNLIHNLYSNISMTFKITTGGIDLINHKNINKIICIKIQETKVNKIYHNNLKTST